MIEIPIFFKELSIRIYKFKGGSHVSPNALFAELITVLYDKGEHFLFDYGIRNSDLSGNLCVRDTCDPPLNLFTTYFFYVIRS